MSSDSEVDEFYDAVEDTPNGSFFQAGNEKFSGDADLGDEEKELLELRRKQEERRKKEDEELQNKLQFLKQKKKEEQLKREEEEKQEQLDRRRRKHEELRRRMMSKEDSVQTSSSADSESDLEDLEDNLDDAAALSRSLTRGIEPGDKYDDLNVNMNASHPEKNKHSHSKEIYDFVDSGSGVDTIDHNFVPDSDGISQDRLQGSYAMDDENEPDIVKSTKTRTPPNTLQGSVHSVTTSQETAVGQMKLRIQTENIVRNSQSDNVQSEFSGVQQIPEPIVTPPSPTFQAPVAPPRRKKKMKLSNSSSGNSQPDELGPPSHRSSLSSISEIDARSLESQGLPSENNEIPVDFERLTKQLEYTLDLRSLIRGKRHIKAEDAEANAVKSDHDSPNHTLESVKADTSSRPSSGKNSKTGSLDRDRKKSKNASLDRNSSFDKKSSFDRTDGRLERKKSKSSSLDKSKSSSLDKDVKVRSRNSSGYEPSPKRDLRPRSASGKDLTDEEILASFIVKNLDTGETTNLKEAETDLPKCVDPLVLHIMERTQDYPSDDNESKDYEYETRSEGGTILSSKKIKKTGSRLKRLLKKKVDKAADKVKTAADQVMHGDDQDSVDDEISDEGRR